MYEWKILSTTSDATGLITEARYYAALDVDGKKVETEGNCYFIEPKLDIPFEEVSEENVIDWVKEEVTKEGKNTVEFRLKEQFEALESQTNNVAPWMPQIFTVGV
jgi:hypothetical protein